MSFRPRLLDSFPGYNPALFAKDVAAGITVGIVALPLAIAIAIASGLPPASGLWAAIVGGFIVALLGGSNVQIAGPANAFIVVVFGIVLAHGVMGLLLATMMAGALMVIMGLLKLGRLMRYVPDALIEGFTSAIAVIILVTQIKDALGLPIAKMPADVFGLLSIQAQALPQFNAYALLLSCSTIALMAFWQALSKRQTWAMRVPGSMLALLAVSVAAFVFKLPTETIGSRFGAAFAQFQQWPTLSFPAVPWEKVPALIIPAFTLAILSGIESLLCARIADDLQPQVKPHAPNQELIAQGVANMAAPLLGALPITGTIARTVTNLKSGGSTPISGMVHSATLLLIMLAAAPLAVHIPLAVLAGILIFIAWHMGDWKTLTHLHKKPREFSAVLGVTFVLTLALSLTWGIAGGLVASWILGKLRT
ncbi:SulP family inorganic anion transporter [Variovorax sp. PCZ-1]|uniref:SulP family inorganic anion transporter n=1 Tax=Variovorax sp. PCZ-1 TaxID=2835533 RepID=UPI001BCDC09A|nr:SulP family inorganic anion transporter [Variovorax sp. PCZ-1]MBS7806349.1 SulP family inorganic anion transporter [Variovorax sp. PCZ-1]